MKKQFKPVNYNSVSPYFVVNNAEQFIELLINVFNGIETRRFNRPDGKIMHAEVKIDDSIIMVSDSSEEYPPNQHLMHVYVPDADTTFSKAIQHGCEAIQPPQQREGDPDRRGMFKDFAGNQWAVGTQQ